MKKPLPTLLGNKLSAIVAYFLNTIANCVVGKTCMTKTVEWTKSQPKTEKKVNNTCAIFNAMCTV